MQLHPTIMVGEEVGGELVNLLFVMGRCLCGGLCVGEGVVVPRVPESGEVLFWGLFGGCVCMCVEM